MKTPTLCRCVVCQCMCFNSLGKSVLLGHRLCTSSSLQSPGSAVDMPAETAPVLLCNSKRTDTTIGRSAIWRVNVLLACVTCKAERVTTEKKIEARVQAVADILNGPVVLAKGTNDTVAARAQHMKRTRSKGSPRRCGGQGDILSGITATTMSWALIHAKKVRAQLVSARSAGHLNAKGKLH